MQSFWTTGRKFVPAFAAAFVLAAPASAGDFSFSGKMFADISQITQHDELAKTRSTATDADLKRLYLDANYVIDPAWSVDVTADVNWLRGKRDPDVWLKHAYVQRKFAKSTWRVGVDDMPLLALTSKWYGYRYIDSLGASMQKLDTVADWGVHVNGLLAPRLDYAVAVVSGGSYKYPTHGQRADVEAVMTWHTSKHTMLALGGYDGQLAASDDRRPVYHTARRVDVMAAYADDTWRLGVRRTYGSNWASVYSMDSDRASVWSAWASVRFAPQWSVFARFDRSRPSTLAHPSRNATFADGGIEWQPVKRLRLALALKRTASLVNDQETKVSNEAGIWTQLVF